MGVGGGGGAGGAGKEGWGVKNVSVISADDILKYASYFFKKTGFDTGDNLHEISKPIFREK